MGFAANQVKRSLKNETVHGKTYFSLEVSPEKLETLPPELMKGLQDLGNNIFLAWCERYLPFTEKMKEMAAHGLSPIEVAGHDKISVVLTSQSPTLPQIPGVNYEVINAYQLPTATNPLATGVSRAQYHVILIPVEQTAALINGADSLGYEIMRFHDY